MEPATASSAATIASAAIIVPSVSLNGTFAGVAYSAMLCAFIGSAVNSALQKRETRRAWGVATDSFVSVLVSVALCPVLIAILRRFFSDTVVDNVLQNAVAFVIGLSWRHVLPLFIRAVGKRVSDVTSGRTIMPSKDETGETK